MRMTNQGRRLCSEGLVIFQESLKLPGRARNKKSLDSRKDLLRQYGCRESSEDDLTR